ncbi:MAG: adenylate/guanylate cyclase domain-containing protein [Chloroflexi bacterium]|nr:adenylate/guanylate cyclase domain-containing protein [Chloroflexota bacterium]
MEQQLGFCTTSDGVSIAYATVGEGAPLVYVTGWPGHLGLEWEKPVARELLEDLAEGVTLIRYDMRGSGLSDHDVPDLSLDAWVKDLEAVIQKLQLDQFTLLALGLLAGPIAIICAAAHREQVTKLILSSAYLRGSELATPERGKAIADYVATFGAFATIDPDTDPSELEKSKDAVQIAREAAPPAVQGAVARAILDADVSRLADRISMPTLVMHSRHDSTVPFGLGRALAAQLSNVRFVPFEASWGAAPWRQQQALLEEIRRFLGVEAVSRPRPLSGDMVTILFTDVEGSTALTHRLGDAKARELLREHERMVREALKAHGGSEVKTMGDGFMASFSSATKALECAIAMQRAFAEHNESAEEPIKVRIGLNAGEPIAEDDDLFGTAVNEAARITAAAEGGEILVSDVVRQLVKGKDFLFADVGERQLKGFDESVRLYEVRWRGKV